MSSSSVLGKALKGSRVIVTGAAGFIGFHLLKTLVELEADVLVIDRVQLSQQLSGVEFEWADLRHLNGTYEGDYLIHLAAVTNAGYAEKYPLDTYETNVLGTVNLLNHVRVYKRVLFPSTALMYRASDIPLTEEAEQEPSSTYAQSKVMGEQASRFLCDRMGVGLTRVRFFNIYGPGQLPIYIVPQVVHQLMEDRKITLRNGSVLRDLLYVDDCTDAVLKLVVAPEAADSVFNIGSGKIVSILDVAKTAVVAAQDEDIDIVDLQENIQYSPTAIVADIAKVKSTVDWAPNTSLEDGLRAMLKSYVGSNNAAATTS